MKNSRNTEPKIWERHRFYRSGRVYVNLCIKSNFSSVRILGRENLEKVPAGGCMMLQSNHCCTMMDPLIVLTALKTPVFGARSDIFRNPKVARVLHWLRILPIARERNGREEVAKNLETFEEIYGCLDAGVPFCLYPEGSHRPERGMMPVKKRASIICKDAADKLGKPVYIIPTGLDYEYFFRQGGQCVLSFGEPIEIREYFAARQGMPEADIYRELCSEIQTRILALIGRIPERRHNLKFLRAIAGLLQLPLFIVCAIGGLPIWGISELICRKMKDKAWRHSVYASVSVCFPLNLLFNHWFLRMKNFYANLFEDFKS